MDDPRFRHVANDPRFKSIPRRDRKVKIDSRFRSMFSDKSFKVKYHVDRRGRKMVHSSSEDLRKYYQLDDGELSGEVGGGGREKKDERRELRTRLVNSNGEEGEERGITSRDFRGESPSTDSSTASEGDESSSTDSDDDQSLDGQSAEIVHPWGGEEEDGVGESEVTSSKLAICSMDWDRITAQDLYVLMNSFKPGGGLVRSVTVYPSDFGMERMAREERMGPAELVEGPGEEADGEGKGYSQERLRQYQLNRLKYYYAVVECDSTATAEYIYEQCDGLEYEHSGGRLDLRFVPDGMKFDDREPKSVSSDTSAEFKPSEFFTSALQQSKVNLTWDETDPQRLQATMKKFTKDDLLTMDFNAYLGSSSEGEGENAEDETSRTEGVEEQIRKYRALLEEGGEEGEGKEEMEITWEPGLREKAEELVRKKKAEQEGGKLTPWESYQVERRERRKEKRRTKSKGEEEEEVMRVEGGKDLGFDDPFFQHDVTMATAQSKKKGSQRKEEVEEGERGQLELLVMEGGEEREHFSLKGIVEAEKEGSSRGKRQRRKRREKDLPPPDTFEVDVHDPRFSAMFESHLYAPDPSHPQYRPTKAMTAIMDEKQKRRKGREGLKEGWKANVSREKIVSDPSVSSLVKSVKAKAKSFTEHRKKLGTKRLKKRHL